MNTNRLQSFLLHLCQTPFSARRWRGGESAKGGLPLLPFSHNQKDAADFRNLSSASNTPHSASGAAGCTLFARTWRDHLDLPLDDENLAVLRLKTHTDHPLGSDSFLSKMERLLGRRVRALPSGRAYPEMVTA